MRKALFSLCLVFCTSLCQASLRTGNPHFDELYALAVTEALANSVSEISSKSYAKGESLQIEAFQTGELWKYVWTRDIAYSIFLAMGQFDPQRSVNSLLFKSSVLKPHVKGGFVNQIVQDTGSGGSYPVSSDRIIWAMGASQVLKFLPAGPRQEFLKKVNSILHDCIEQDRQLLFDSTVGLYRGEESFLDWREQSYPSWVKDNVLPIAMSKALSVNAAYFFMLKTASEYAGLLELPIEQRRYSQWAESLKGCINNKFFDRKSGLYSSYLLSEDGSVNLRASRYDLLGESLAILFEIADHERALLVLKSYPVGPFGPPVVHPQERGVPVYHNQAIWPFVTSFWIKAAKKVGNAAAVDAGIQSLQKHAAANRSNMEAVDFISGQADTPLVNSPRQLWSVAGYLSMVQDVIFGLEASLDGIRFRPCITAKLRNETFSASDTIELVNFAYQGTQNQIRLHLPSFTQGIASIDRIEVNGKLIGDEFVSVNALQTNNLWEIFLKADTVLQGSHQIRLLDVQSNREIFAPAQPQWQQNALTLDGGHITLNFQHPDAANVRFTILRDGELVAENIAETKWTDPEAYQNRVHAYQVAAVDTMSGTVSYPTSSKAYRLKEHELILDAKSLHHRGGHRIGTHHFEKWGKPHHTLVSKHFSVKRAGTYLVKAEFSNGSGPINTGMTCAVKKLELYRAISNELVASGYLVMPQSGSWTRFDFSTAITARLKPHENYFICLSEDPISRNMSYLKSNERYTAGLGGGDGSFNFVNIASLHLLFTDL